MGVLKNYIQGFKIDNIEVLVGQKWSEVIKAADLNEDVNSIFILVDNGNGIVDKQEVDMLNQMKIESKLNEDNDNYIKNFYDFVKNNVEKFRQKTSVDNNEELKTNWSETLNRHISTISVDAYTAKILQNELGIIADELGFDIKILEKKDGHSIIRVPWLEDYGIRRADGKMLFVADETINKKSKIDFKEKYGLEINQGMSISGIANLERNISSENSIYTECYLEGGNVLNTLNSNGEPAAVIGEDSITLTLGTMGLEKTDENVNIVKNKIAEDLGLKPENVTFIPQHIFHIDMAFRPIGNGQIAVPDYESAIILVDEEITKERNGDNNPEKIAKLETYKTDMVKMYKESKEKILSAEEELSSNGYQIVKVPCFTTCDKSLTNHMNGIMGTTKDITLYSVPLNALHVVSPINQSALFLLRLVL